VLRLHDTATGEVTPLSLRTPGQVSLYVCGPTVDGVPHLGHGRFSLVFDVLRRYLIFTGLDVTYVSNITDIEDKIIDRAAAAGVDIGEFTAANEALWWRIMDALGVLRPDETPHATAYVDRMVALVADLVSRGVAYETGDGVYLSVMDVPGYGLLARQPLDSLRAGARVAADEEKQSPLDFVLWKKAKPDEPSWESPWGPGRPGWHTECVVMSLDLLGDGFDLHGGGLDLAFPHHENERAQAVADGHSFARHWVHNGFVTVDGEKMSKSLGNFTSLEDLLDRSDARAYRMLVLRSHYRSPIEVTPGTIADAEAGLARLDELARRFDLADWLAEGPVVDGTGTEELDAEAIGRFRQAMDDDLDTPGALAALFDLVRRANAAYDAGQADEAARTAATIGFMCAALGIRFRPRSTTEIDPAGADLVARRDRARVARDWGEADSLRRQLESAGWVVEDGPEGTRIRHR
jgi:cysteinyl-tRNA synthetase